MSNYKNSELFAARMHGARERCGLSYRKLSEKCGLSATFLCKIENNSGEMPSAKSTRRLAEVLDIPSAELLMLAGHVDFEELLAVSHAAKNYLIIMLQSEKHTIPTSDDLKDIIGRLNRIEIVAAENGGFGEKQ